MKTAGIVIMLAIAAYVVFGFLNQPPKHTGLPPRYSLACSANGEYVAVMPYGTIVHNNNWKKTKQSAIESAWEQYEFGLGWAPNPEKNIETSKIWKRCDE